MYRQITTKKYQYLGSKICIYLWYLQQGMINWIIGEGMEFDYWAIDSNEEPKNVRIVIFKHKYDEGSANCLIDAKKKIHRQMLAGNDAYKEMDVIEVWTEEYMEAVSCDYPMFDFV